MKLSLLIVLMGALLAPRTILADDTSLVEKARLVLDLLQVVGNVGAEVIKEVVDVEDPVEQQFAPSFRLVMQAELRFLRNVCQPTPEQYQSLKSAGEAGLKSAVKRAAATQNRMNQGVRRLSDIEWPNPQQIITDSLFRAAMRTLSADQTQRYQSELEKRDAARKRAAILNLVAKLDHDLVLTAEQRQQFVEKLKDNWQVAWGRQIELYHYGDQYMPVLSTHLVSPLLTKEQEAIWQGLPKGQNTIWGWSGFAFVRLVDVGEDADLAAPANAAAAVK